MSIFERLFGNSKQKRIKSLDLSFVHIPAGRFIMGSPETEEGHHSFHERQHEVTISRPFLMQTTTVTQKQWIAVMGVNPAYIQQGDDLPAENVENANVALFIEKLNILKKGEGLIYMLPTSAEWEYACRAGTRTQFCSGDTKEDLEKAGWFQDSEFCRYLNPVAQKTPNAWGLYDMHGNVWELCRDYMPDGIVSSAPVINPCYYREDHFGNQIMRGGSSYSHPEECRSAHIYGGTGGLGTGFRLAAYS